MTEHAHGSLGNADISAAQISLKKGSPWRSKLEGTDPYQVEHDALFAAIRSDTPHNEVEYGAHSTMTAILGRMATYSGKIVTWDEAINSKLSLWPAELDWKANPPTLPDAAGLYPIPMPGVSQAF